MIVDQCMYGLESVDREGRAPAKKPTKFMTNVIGTEQFLSTRCDRGHRHVELLNNRARAAQTPSLLEVLMDKVLVQQLG